MAILNGTGGDSDRLVGTNDDDLIIADGAIGINSKDTLIGKGGADTYQLTFGSYVAEPRGVIQPNYVINETSAGDASVDTITGVRGFHYGTISDTGSNYTHFTRTGASGEHLFAETAFRPTSFRTTSIQSGTIKIVNQYDATGNATVEKMVAAGVEYNLVTTDTGTVAKDVMTGWKNSDTLHAGAGDDYLYGGGGRDYLYGEDGNDTIFGDGGSDFMYGGAGADKLFGGNGNDKLFGGDDSDYLFGGAGEDTLKGENGNDYMYGGAGNDKVIGGAGDDFLFGNEGNDKLFGGAGNDTLRGNAGDDILTGNAGNDVYVINTSLGGGNDTIIEKGNAKGSGNYDGRGDEIHLDGFTNIDTLAHSLDFNVSGNDFVLNYNNDGVTGQVTVKDHFVSAKYAMENVTFGVGGHNGTFHISELSGDNYTYSVHAGTDGNGHDIITGTAGDDMMYGGIGYDILKGGAGADTFLFNHEGISGGHELILDFNMAEDRLNFEELKDLTISDLQLSDNAYGNVEIYGAGLGTIELAGLTTADISGSDIYTFANTPDPVDPTPVDPAPVDPAPVDPAPVDPAPTGDLTLDQVLADPRFADIDFNIAPKGEGDQMRGEEGGHAHDIVTGTADEDELFGGQGTDILSGGAGADIFVYKDEGGNGGHEYIIDFDSAEDLIDFSKILDLGRADVTVADNAYGNAEISGASFGSIELAGYTASQITDSIFVFNDPAVI